MKNRQILPITFVAVSSLAFALSAYLLVTKTTLHPQPFITTCVEILQNIQVPQGTLSAFGIHLNLDGILSLLIVSVTTLSVGLAILQLILFIISHTRLRKLHTQEKLPENLRKILCTHGVSESAVAVVKNNKKTAYVIGVFAPKIIISKVLIDELSQKQLEAVVLHELYHLRSRHLLWLFVSRLVSSLFFFIPLVTYLANQLKTEFELAADAFVVEKQKTTDHLRSSLALNIGYKVNSEGREGALGYGNGIALHFATTAIEKRVSYLIENRFTFEKINGKQLSLSLLSFGCMLGIALVQPNQVGANFTVESGGICRIEEGCQTTDCSGHQTSTSLNFSPVVSASFPFSH